MDVNKMDVMYEREQTADGTVLSVLYLRLRDLSTTVFKPRPGILIQIRRTS